MEEVVLVALVVKVDKSGAVGEGEGALNVTTMMTMSPP
jgi:hypothetical protein